MVSSPSGGFCQESLPSFPMFSLRDTFPALAYFKILCVCVTGFEQLEDFSDVVSVFLGLGAVELFTSVGF